METITTDVLVIGAGAAGIRAALAAFEEGVDVFLVAKDQITRSGSTFSPISKGWGIQALVGPERTNKNSKNFYDDIIRVGLGRCVPKLVRILVEESGDRLQDLIRYGIRFKKDTQGNFVRSKGCFSNDERAFVTEDLSNIQQSFTLMVQGTSIKMIIANVLDLMVADGECWGAWALTPDGEFLSIRAKATVLATGGGAGIFSDHLVSDGEIGDGYALAYRAGAALNNMEFIQFMLGLKKHNMRMFLPLPEIHKPGRLLDADGFDLLEKHIADPNSRHNAIVERKKHFPFSCRDSSYLVDLAVAEEGRNNRTVFWEDGSNSKERFEVVHFSHAFNGGVNINETAESTVPGLFAAGETASGPHGADRIGGCMMTATQVFGKRAGQFAAIRAQSGAILPNKIGIPEYIQKSGRRKGPELKDQALLEIEKHAREKLSRELMVVRDDNGLNECLVSIESLIFSLKEAKVKNDRIYFELRNSLLVGKLVALNALNRNKSLGSHYRE
jgi:fumarate reductase (CoM/CoB) subunit A